MPRAGALTPWHHHHRPFTCALVSVCWAVYISYVAAAADRVASPAVKPESKLQAKLA